jgi:hypothetical protein
MGQPLQIEDLQLFGRRIPPEEIMRIKYIEMAIYGAAAACAAIGIFFNLF